MLGYGPVSSAVQILKLHVDANVIDIVEEPPADLVYISKLPLTDEFIRKVIQLQPSCNLRVTSVETDETSTRTVFTVDLTALIKKKVPDGSVVAAAARQQRMQRIMAAQNALLDALQKALRPKRRWPALLTLIALPIIGVTSLAYWLLAPRKRGSDVNFYAEYDEHRKNVINVHDDDDHVIASVMTAGDASSSVIIVSNDAELAPFINTALSTALTAMHYERVDDPTPNTWRFSAVAGAE
jgi:rRNA-processing protein FCF1